MQLPVDHTERLGLVDICAPSIRRLDRLSLATHQLVERRVGLSAACEALGVDVAAPARCVVCGASESLQLCGQCSFLVRRVSCC